MVRIIKLGMYMLTEPWQAVHGHKSALKVKFSSTMLKLILMLSKAAEGFLK